MRKEVTVRGTVYKTVPFVGRDQASQWLEDRKPVFYKDALFTYSAAHGALYNGLLHEHSRVLARISLGSARKAVPKPAYFTSVLAVLAHVLDADKGLAVLEPRGAGKVHILRRIKRLGGCVDRVAYADGSHYNGESWHRARPFDPDWDADLLEPGTSTKSHEEMLGSEGYYMAFNTNLGHVGFFRLKKDPSTHELTVWGLSLHEGVVDYRTYGTPLTGWLEQEHEEMLIVKDYNRAHELHTSFYQGTRLPPESK